MKRIIIILYMLQAGLYAQVNFDEFFENKSLRFDYFHIGNYSSEQFVFDEMKAEPYYGGSKTNLIDTFYYGNHFFKVFDAEEDVLIYSRGYCSLFQEWQSTEEATKIDRSFEETIILPYPKQKIRLELYSRDKEEDNEFVKKFEYIIDPANYFISSENKEKYTTLKLKDSGNPAEKLDIVVIPDGYTTTELGEFVQKIKELSEYLFEYEPFASSRDKINIWAVLAPSEDSGTDIPGDSVWTRTVVNSSFYTLDSERYLMTTDVKGVRDVAGSVPYDQIIILVNTDKYGGGAIYNYYSMVCANHPYTPKIFVHEFGHGFAGLADEYGDDPTYNDYYPEGVEPWEPNITTLADFDKKWKYLIDEDTPIPTPADEKFRDKVGVFEGAGYVSEGVYRSTFDSIMRSLGDKKFNKVSQDAMKKLIDFYSE